MSKNASDLIRELQKYKHVYNSVSPNQEQSKNLRGAIHEAEALLKISFRDNLDTPRKLLDYADELIISLGSYVPPPIYPPPFVLILSKPNNQDWLDNVISVLEDLKWNDYWIAEADNIPNTYQSDVFKAIDEKLKEVNTLVIADLTDNDPHVFLRLGMAHARSERVVMSHDPAKPIPFDIRGRHVIAYDVKNAEDLTLYIAHLKSVLSQVHHNYRDLAPFWGQAVANPTYSTQVFFGFPFTANYFTIYDNYIKKEFGSRKIRIAVANKEWFKLTIMQQIWAYIQSCCFFCAECTDGNPNVLYELGLAYALGKHFIAFAEDGKMANIPKEIGRYRILFYKPNNAKRLNDLATQMADAIAGELPNCK